MPRRNYPPLQFDWTRLGEGSLYRAKPDTTFFLYAFRGGGSWRWSISMLGEGQKLVPLYDAGPLHTLLAAKHGAESWYLAHGGNPMQPRLEFPEPVSLDEWLEVLPF